MPELRGARHRNYRLFYSGQGISLIGTWMTRVATGWLVYRLTHSAFLLGLVSFSGQIPILLLGPLAGVWVDRLNRHRVLVVTQVLSMLQSFALAALALSGVITVLDIILLNLFQGAVNAFVHGLCSRATLCQSHRITVDRRVSHTLRILLHLWCSFGALTVPWGLHNS